MSAEQRQAAMEAAQRCVRLFFFLSIDLNFDKHICRSQSSKRYQEMERERKRRQLKTAGGENKTSFIQTAKLGLMNSGLISLKKGEKMKISLLKKRGEKIRKSPGKPTECVADKWGPLREESQENIRIKVQITPRFFDKKTTTCKV